MAPVIIAGLAILQLLGGNFWPALSQRLVTKAAPAQPSLIWDSYQNIPTPVGSAPQLNMSAQGVVAIDAATGQVLYDKAANQPHSIASITKIFTALVILKDHKLDEVVTVPSLPPYRGGAVVLGLVPGQRFKLQELLKAALIPSANDAADSLAIWDSGSVANFTTKMNQLVQEWGIEDLHFNSASGLEDSNNYASPLALSKAARLLLSNRTAQAITSTYSGSTSDLAGRSYPLTSTNQLLQEPGFKGIKTGYTPAAGECLLALALVNSHPVITVVVGSQSRFDETRQLIQALGQNYQWQ
jgi:D-alanyl-D-alanine carboxypeptidase (penicillin-binding protein 5/6)